MKRDRFATLKYPALLLLCGGIFAVTFRLFHLPVAAALYPECIETCDKYFCEVDVSNGPGYGNVIVDRCNVTGKEPNVYICSKLYANKFKHYMYKTLRVC